MVLTLPNYILPVNQTLLWIGLQHVLEYLRGPILLYHDGSNDIDTVAQRILENNSMYVTKYPETPYSPECKKPVSTVLIAKNPEIINAAFRKWDLYDARAKILVIVDSKDDVHGWIDRLWSKTRAVDVVVMVLAEPPKFFTWFPYKKKECTDVLTITELKLTNLFPEKMIPPFHNCSFSGVYSLLPPLVLSEQLGMESRLFKTLLHKFGLKPTFVYLPPGQYVWTMIDENEQPLNALRLLWENKADAMFSAVGPMVAYGFSDFLPPHHKDQMMWFVPAPKIASKITSIVRAFSPRMWFLVFSSSICIWGTLIITAFFTGTPVRTVFLNTLRISLNSPSQWARSQRFLVFICFAYLYSLHITTAYQTSLMIFLSDVPREKPISTIEDLTKSNLYIEIHEAQKALADYLASTSAYNELLRPERVSFVNYLFIENLVKFGNFSLLGPRISFGYSLVVDPIFYDENGYRLVIIMDEVVVSTDVSFLISKGHPLVPLFSTCILRMLAAGLPQRYLREISKPPPKIHLTVTPFGMEEIKGPFLLYAGLITLSLIAWLAEIICYYSAKKCTNNGFEIIRKPYYVTHFRLSNLLRRK